MLNKNSSKLNDLMEKCDSVKKESEDFGILLQNKNNELIKENNNIQKEYKSILGVIILLFIIVTIIIIGSIIF